MTNNSAMAALQTLRTIGAGLASQQMQVSSGLRISNASDNAAYWSIATSMRSDKSAVSAVSDALAVGHAKIDTAYAGMTSVIDVLSEFKSKLVAAKEDGVDKSKIQEELDQLKKQVVSISQSSSFNGMNYLQSDISDIFDPQQTVGSVVSSFVRGSDGGVSVNTADFDLSKISLFNSTGGGLLQADPRDVKTIGGLRFGSFNAMSSYSAGNTGGGGAGGEDFWFTGPMTFGAGDVISFDLTVDADNPADGIPGPYDPGTTAHVFIDQATVNAALGVSDGHIATYTDYTRVINKALGNAGAHAFATNYTHPEPPHQDVIYVPTIDEIGIVRTADPTKDGSSFQISNLVSTIPGNGGLSATAGINYGHRASSMTLNFQPFNVAGGVVINFNFSTDRGGSPAYSFDRDYINTLLGKDDGTIQTPAEMATLLNSLIARPDVIIADNGAGGVTVKTDVMSDRKSGEKSAIGFNGINVNIEPIPTLNFTDIDIVHNPDLVDNYLSYIEITSNRITDAASKLGSLIKRIDMQTDFASKLQDSIGSGVGRLVDADMEEASARFNAMQTQQQLAVQALSIANQAPQNVLTLFRN